MCNKYKKKYLRELEINENIKIWLSVRNESIANVRILHKTEANFENLTVICKECKVLFPCSTIQALDREQ